MNNNVTVMILGMCAVTYLPRMLPLLYGAKYEMSPALRRWIKYVPTAVFAALVFPDLFLADGQLQFNIMTNFKLIAAVLVFPVALKTRSMLWSIVAGTGSLWLLTTVFS